MLGVRSGLAFSLTSRRNAQPTHPPHRMVAHGERLLDPRDRGLRHRRQRSRRGRTRLYSPRRLHRSERRTCPAPIGMRGILSVPLITSKEITSVLFSATIARPRSGSSILRKQPDSAGMISTSIRKRVRPRRADPARPPRVVPGQCRNATTATSNGIGRPAAFKLRMARQSGLDSARIDFVELPAEHHLGSGPGGPEHVVGRTEDWLGRKDSNLRSPDPETCTGSSNRVPSCYQIPCSVAQV
jgi:hypothetical protein